MADCVIVFAKNPVPSGVKTRLIPFLSADRVASLYKAFLIDWCDALSTLTVHRESKVRQSPALRDFAPINRDLASLETSLNLPPEGSGQADSIGEPHLPTESHSSVHLVIAYTPPNSRSALQALIGQKAIYIPQVGADLGERLISAAQWACGQNYAKFLFVGSDSPTLPIQYVERALDLLDSRDVVIGPSMDGGYYLIGFSAGGAALAIPAIFEDITWSTDLVFRQTLEKVQSVNARLGLLPPWYDVDTFADLQLLRNHLFAMRLAGEKIPAPQTDSKLAGWL
ncbi:glycosyltransferase [Candidatus Poribacteria bacterium]|nr:glycosyltransferase [Candidatus Poribacteria bacterium]